MCTRQAKRAFRRAKTCAIVASLLALCIAVIPLGSAAAATSRKTAPKKAKLTAGGATFDLFSMFPKQMLAPSAGATFTFMFLDTRNIVDSTEVVSLSAQCDSSYFSACIFPCKVAPQGANGTACSFVFVNCRADTPDGTVCWIKVTGKRGTEQHHVWLEVTALASKPQLDKSSGDLGTGQGYKDPDLLPFAGKPLVWNVGATNHGFLEDTYPLGCESDFPCSVRFLDSAGNPITSVKVRGLTRNYLYPTAVNFKAEVTPTGPLPKNQPLNVRFVLGPGAFSSGVSKLPVQVIDAGSLFCVNDTGGWKPRAHQVMAGEATSFLLHASNRGTTPADFSLTVSGGAPGWDVGLDHPLLNALQPGETREATLTVKAPAGAGIGTRLDLGVHAASSLGATDDVAVATEVTNVRNVYYWSIDSMDPSYLYMNRAGTGPGSDGDWLMPNIHAFLSDCVDYTSARDYLPSATDMNHTNALAGTYSGTSGIYTVGGGYAGFDQHDDVLAIPNTVDLMRYGPDGKPLERIYEVAKKETGGKSLNEFVTNKNWLGELEAGRNVDILCHSEKFPLFFPGPYKYTAGDPKSDTDPWDPLSGPFTAAIYSDITREVTIPTLLGQFNFLIGLGISLLPVEQYFGMAPGAHAEDRYLNSEYMRTVIEEDPDVSYMNIADLDNTGHVTGASWDFSEWDTKGTPQVWDDVSKYNPWMRRDECLDIERENDLQFADFMNLLKTRGVYDNSIIVLFSDHSMENLKDPGKGFQVIDLRQVLRAGGFVYNEDFRESGGAGSFVWSADPSKTAAMELALRNYTVNDPLEGVVHPFIVVNRQEMKDGKDFGALGKILPMELYSEWWINHPEAGQLWPDLFVFQTNHYDLVIHGNMLATGFNPVGMSLGNLPDSVQIGFPATHGGLTTDQIPLVFKAPKGWPGFTPGAVVSSAVRIGDITPTIYQIMGWAAPACVNGTPLPKP
jgi:hypothetical protein